MHTWMYAWDRTYSVIISPCMYKIIICSVFYLAGEFAVHLQKQLKLDFPTRQDLFSDGEIICIEIAGLCHDLGITEI